MPYVFDSFFFVECSICFPRLSEPDGNRDKYVFVHHFCTCTRPNAQLNSQLKRKSRCDVVRFTTEAVLCGVFSKTSSNNFHFS
jgi:predicted nucleic acid-binding Zn finger protein